MTEFERFFEAFQRKLEVVQIPPEMFSGGPDAADRANEYSWDRKAAYLLFIMMKKLKPQ